MEPCLWEIHDAGRAIAAARVLEVFLAGRRRAAGTVGCVSAVILPEEDCLHPIDRIRIVKGTLGASVSRGTEVYTPASGNREAAAGLIARVGSAVVTHREEGDATSAQ